MSIVLYSRYRRQRLAGAWHLAGMNAYVRRATWRTAQITLALAACVAYLAFADQQIALQDRIEQATVAAERSEAAWVSCLNNRGVWIDGRLHLCNLADTHLAREQFAGRVASPRAAR